MKFGIVVAVIFAGGLSTSVAAEPRIRRPAVAAYSIEPSPAAASFTPYVSFGMADGSELAPLNPDAPVTKVVTLPPPAVEKDDEVVPPDSEEEMSSSIALTIASVAVLMFIAGRLRQDP
jgi:hypothetical protein